jgi:hypothetical protein
LIRKDLKAKSKNQKLCVKHEEHLRLEEKGTKNRRKEHFRHVQWTEIELSSWSEAFTWD